jgi:serine/threonine protein kinase
MAQSLPNGTQLAGYTVLDQIGRGGFGITYRATAANGAVVALKEYFPVDYAHRSDELMVHPAPDSNRIYFEGLRAFLSEANTLKSLPQVAGLVQVRAAFEKFGTAYCVMDYIEGEPLSRLVPRVIQRDGHVPEALVLDFVAPICLALEAVHSCHLVHRDVKPANIMIRRADNAPVLIDFGAARSAGQKPTAMSMLTLKYAPIELFPAHAARRGAGMQEGAWTDVFSLSVMLYEMMAQEAPPDAQTRLVQTRQGRADPLRPLAEMAARRGLPAYSEQLMRAIDVGCALRPELRPQTARELARTLGVDLGSVAVRRPMQPSPLVHAGAGRAAGAPVAPSGNADDARQRSVIAMLVIILGIAILAVVLGASNM